MSSEPSPSLQTPLSQCILPLGVLPPQCAQSCHCASCCPREVQAHVLTPPGHSSPACPCSPIDLAPSVACCEPFSLTLPHHHFACVCSHLSQDPVPFFPPNRDTFVIYLNHKISFPSMTVTLEGDLTHFCIHNDKGSAWCVSGTYVIVKCTQS